MTIAIHTQCSDSTTPVTDYLDQDHLGSIIAFTAADGSITEHLSCDLWSKRRQATGSNAWRSLAPGGQSAR